MAPGCSNVCSSAETIMFCILCMRDVNAHALKTLHFRIKTITNFSYKRAFPSHTKLFFTGFFVGNFVKESRLETKRRGKQSDNDFTECGGAIFTKVWKTKINFIFYNFKKVVLDKSLTLHTFTFQRLLYCHNNFQDMPFNRPINLSDILNFFQH